MRYGLHTHLSILTHWQVNENGDVMHAGTCISYKNNETAEIRFPCSKFKSPSSSRLGLVVWVNEQRILMFACAYAQANMSIRLLPMPKCLFWCERLANYILASEQT